LPTLEEVFGDGLLILPNLELQPETSHNANLGAALEFSGRASGSWSLEVNGFLRETKNQIIQGPPTNQDLSLYENVLGSRSVGAEATKSWTSPRDYVRISTNVTHLDFRNTSGQGTFAKFEGDRFPNRPYLFGNGAIRFQLRGASTLDDELSFTWFTRYVHEFYRSWESVGPRHLKDVIPSQLVHSATLVHEVRLRHWCVSNGFEIQNVTDRPTYDYFGVPRPGRAFYYKVTAEL
jgi:outer membrane receptor for ferrienterochelin and colicin